MLDAFTKQILGYVANCSLEVDFVPETVIILIREAWDIPKPEDQPAQQHASIQKNLRTPLYFKIDCE